MKIKSRQFYEKLLPKRITVLTRKTKTGNYWAEVKGKGLENCFTQAENFGELIKMVNDVIFDYLEIPIKIRKELGHYLPSSFIKALKEDVIRRRGAEILRYINEQTKIKREVAFSLV